MYLTDEQMKQQSHELALRHDPVMKRASSARLWRTIESDLDRLRDFVRELQHDRTACAQPAEEWLLDHAEFIEAEAFSIKEARVSNIAKRLPFLRNEGMLRVSSICSKFLELTDGRWEEEKFADFVKSYQDVSVLRISEAWSLVLFMKIEVIRRLSELMETVRERRAICKLAERVLDSIPPSELSAERLKEALEAAGLELPLSGALTAHLVQHLREYAEDAADVGEWLVCHLENGSESLDQILSYEFQLQAAFQVTAGNLMGSLRKLSRLRGTELFERICVVEQALREERAGDYPRLDDASRDVLRRRVEHLARRMRVPEYLVASQAVELANKAFAEHEESLAQMEASDPEKALPPRRTYTAYYLLEADGIAELRKALKACGKTGAMPELALMRRPTRTYFRLLGTCFAVFLLAFLAWIAGGGPLTAAAAAASLAALVLPAGEWAVTAAHWLIEKLKRPIRLLRYDFSRGVPEEAATMVVIPVIWSTAEEVRFIAERLEMHYLANRDPNIHFAILSDFKDGNAAEEPQDHAVLKAAKDEIERLNRSYPETSFYLFHRSRTWNGSEGVWMGWERKRGKLVEFVELLKGKKDTTFSTIVGDMEKLRNIRYVITLDADTQLPLESARRMIGAIHLPYNRPRLNETRTRVAEGYGILQPRIGMSLESAQRSRFAALFSGEPGFDPYAFAVSDPYQDALGQGIFTGKGIFDVDAFHEILSRRIPDNRVLSHDLLEGGFLRAGLLSDIELVDDHPPTFYAYQKRLHRWVRGDWQLLPWLRKIGPDRFGKPVRIDITALTRWQIVDNLRRSLTAPALMALLIAAPALPVSAARWYAVVFFTLLVPFVRQCLSPFDCVRRPRRLALAFAHAAVNFLTLPYQAALMLDAIVRSLYRLYISKRRLLEWTSQAEVERASMRRGVPALAGRALGTVFAVLTALTAFFGGEPAAAFTGVMCTAVWLCAPAIIRWMDRAPERERVVFTAEEAEELRRLSRELWAYYEDYVTAEDNWLPPDNVQFDPPKGVAHRTSPTNIGLYLASAVAARDFGFIDTEELVERVERTIGTIEKLEKWEGHLYNWYDTETLEPLQPVYVSTVDSGNFVVCLIAVREGVLEWARAEDGPGSESLRERADRVAERLDAIVHETNFRPLFDAKANLFSLGYHVQRQERDTVLYDLLASEARQASFIAIALGQVSVSHWNALGRTMTKANGRPVLLSWSGTMFEYLMPWLLMRTYRGTVWEHTYRSVVARQIEYGRQRNVPFGISESGFYAFDHQLNYQYRAFGVPGLGFKRGLEDDLVLAPYATILAMPFAKRESIEALRRMEKLGARGKYGFYEAIDFTPKRMPEGKQYMVVQSFMAHHQGMAFLALANLMLPQTMIERFHRDKEVRAAEMLLQERLPARPALIRHPAMRRVHEPHERLLPEPGEVREFTAADTRTPETCILSNGSYTTVVTNAGGGFSCTKDIAVTRWREDPVRDAWGSFVYIRDATNDALWSAAYLPCRREPDEMHVAFELGRATFTRVDGDVRTMMEVCVSPETDAEVRRLTLTVLGSEAKVLEVTTFYELSLASPIADESHPAFTKLFVRTAYDEAAECVTALRRPRSEKESELWAAHTLRAEGEELGPPEFETDRAAFLGRGRGLHDPAAAFSRLTGKSGSVADPAFIMRRRVRVEPGKPVQLIAVTAVAGTREAAVSSALRLAGGMEADRTFRLAWKRTRTEVRSLQLSLKDAAIFQQFGGQLLYTPPLKKERAEQIVVNRKGQSSLWSFGISGDRPIALVIVENVNQLPFVARLLAGYEYLRRLGISFDLVLVNKSESGYFRKLQESLQRLVERGVDRFGAGSAGIHILAELSEEDLTLLYAAARVILHAGGPSLAAQLRLPRAEALPAPFVPTKQAPPAAEELWQAPDLAKLKFANGYGGFAPDGKSYRIIWKPDVRLPAPWINVLSNPNFGCIVSELGTGYTWWRNSREFKLTPWTNDPLLDPPSEIAYLRDEEDGSVWTPAPPPQTDAAGPAVPPYAVTHARGFTRFEHERYGLHTETTIYVAPKDAVKIVRVHLRNNSQHVRRLSLTYYAEWVLGVFRAANAPHLVTAWNADARIMTVRNAYQEVFREATAFLGIFDGSGRDGELTWTADQQEFIGRNRNAARPAALEREQLSCRTGVFHASCGAVQRKMELAPGEERNMYILLGCGESAEEAVRLAKAYADPKACEAAFEETLSFWERVLGQIQVSTPSPEMDTLLNGWLLYQTLGCRLWARTAFYQAGGAYGFRDQLQDCLALLHSMPEAARNQVLLHAAHQYEEGDVQHWWHEETERGIRTKFTDDLLWLPYVVSRYVEHTGDRTLLEERAPYIASEPLGPDEHERYEETRLSGNDGTVYEHCIRAIEKALSRIGEHGLPLIGVGDWNDGLSSVGDEGRGESVWLAWFLCDVLRRFETLAGERGEAERAQRFAEARERIAAAANEHGWDGQWYRRAKTDEGKWLGSIEAKECRIDAIAQSWSVISGAAPRERSIQAMASFDRELVDRELNVARLLTPPFEYTEPSPGYIQGYPPGIRENGAQYTHGVLWGVMAWAQLGDGDKAFELFHLINPINHARTEQDVRRYVGEPYAVAADVYTAAPHEGRAGWTWYTGAAGWMYQVGLEWILGIRRREDRLIIDPRLPSDWPGYRAVYRFGSAVYDIEVRRLNSAQDGAAGSESPIRTAVTVDGVPAAGSGGDEAPWFALKDDGKRHAVEVLLS